MSTIPAINIGIQGIQKGMDGLRQNAQQIASSVTSNSGGNDIAAPLIEMNLNKLEVELSAKVVKSASDMIGTLLDITA